LLGAAAGLGLGDADPLLSLLALALLLLEADAFFLLEADAFFLFATLALGFLTRPPFGFFGGANFILDLLDSLSLQVFELFECDQG